MRREEITHTHTHSFHMNWALCGREKSWFGNGHTLRHIRSHHFSHIRKPRASTASPAQRYCSELNIEFIYCRHAVSSVTAIGSHMHTVRNMLNAQCPIPINTIILLKRFACAFVSHISSTEIVATVYLEKENWKDFNEHNGVHSSEIAYRN